LEQLNTYLRLPDVYQLIGGAEYSNWVQHEIGLIKDDRFHITSLAPYLQPNKSEYFRIRLLTDKRLKYSLADDTQELIHTRLTGLLLEKFLRHSLLVVVILNNKLIEGNVWQQIDDENISIIESTITIGDSIANILVEPESAKNLAKSLMNDRVRRETNPKRTGRPPDKNNDLILAIIREVSTQHPTERNKSTLAKQVAVKLRNEHGIDADSDKIRKMIDFTNR